MTLSIRLAAAATATFTLAALAQAEPVRSEPLLAMNSTSIPRPAALVSVTPLATPAPAPQPGFRDPLAPTATNEVAAPAATAKVASSATPSTPADLPEPVVALPKGLSLASLVGKLRATSVPTRELECLAGAIYFESKSEPLAGQLAVGEVIANRTTSGKFPRKYCGVVFQSGQFSFVRGGAMPRINRAHVQWKNAVAIAKIVDDKLHARVMPKALFFHATHVSPGWRRARVATLGRHVFYR